MNVDRCTVFPPVGNRFRHIVLVGVICAVAVACGGLLGGHVGVILSLSGALLVVSFSWLFSDRLVIRASGARPIDTRLPTHVEATLTELASQAGVPAPRCYVVPSPQPNAFAVGRTPRNAAIVVTEGFLSLLEPAEIRAVLAHELVHIRRRDTLITAVAGATFSALFSMIQVGARHGPLRTGRRGHDPSVPPPRGLTAAFGMIRHARRGRRESEADRCGSDLCGDPEALARALARIGRYAQVVPMDMALAHVSNWVVNPLGDQGASAWLFATCPPLSDRIERLMDASQEPLRT